MRVCVADVVFDSSRRSVTRDGEVLHLSPKAFDLLELLVRERPRAVRKEEIVDALWPDVFVEEANVRNLVAEIRGAIGEAAGRAIVTLPKIGYAFHGDRHDGVAPRFVLMVDGSDFPVGDGATLVGRADDCDIIVRTSGVSRHHIRVVIEGGSAVVEDLGSKNGTFLNGKKLAKPSELRPGDHLVAGCAVMQFRILGAENPTTTLSGMMPAAQTEK